MCKKHMGAMHRSKNTGSDYRFDFIFCGGSFAAAGAAAKLADAGKKVLILDAAGLPGSEFSLTFDCGKVPDGGRLRSAADELYRELYLREAISGKGLTEPSALAPILCHILLRREGRITYFPSSVLTKVKKIYDGWSIEFVTNGARHTATAGYLVGSGLYGIPGTASDMHIKEKYLTGLAECKTPDISDTDIGICHICQGFSGGDAIVKFKFSPDTPMRDARCRILELVSGGLFDGTGIRLVALAEEFSVVSDAESRVYADRYARLVPVRYGDAVSAYGDGALFAEELLKVPAGVAPLRPSDSETADSKNQYDLIVAGLGAAGSIAAVAAARLGLRVLGIEKGNQPGGVGSAGGIHSYYLGYTGGLYLEADALAAELQESGGFIRERGCGLLTKGLALDRLLSDAGVDVVYGAAVCGAIHGENEPDRIIGVEYSSSESIKKAFAPVSIDATADSALCLLSGCPMLGGRESDGGFQLFSNVSRFLNRETDCTASKNQDDGLVDQYDPVDLGKKTLASTVSTLHLKDSYSAGKYRRIGAASYLGVREGLRIVGKDIMTLSRAADCPRTKAVFYEYSNLDSHAKDFAFESRAYRDAVELCSLWDCRISIPVTKDCLIPANTRGLLAAGRNISVDHDISLACRMMRTMQKCGEAAGVLAALAVKKGTSPENVDDSELRTILEARGVVSQSDHFGMYYYTSSPETRRKKDLCELNSEELSEMLASDAPGAAVYACMLNSKLSDTDLLKMLDDEHSRKGAALALAARGRKDLAGDAIIEMIKDRSGEIPASSHTFCLPYAVSAMSAAGKCGITDALPALFDIICDPNYADGIKNRDTVNDKTKLICDNDDVKYLYLTAAIGAVNDIFLTYPESVRKTAKAFPKPSPENYITGASMIGRTDGVRNSSKALIRQFIDKVWGDI